MPATRSTSATPTPAASPPPPAALCPPPNALSLRGEYWEVRYDGRSAMIEDCRGLRYIALLLQRAPDAGPVHAKELVAIATGAPHGGTELERKEPVLDTTARQQLADRLREIAAERERATAVEDFDRAAALDDECERLATELSHNRTPRRGGAFADAGEKARKAVSKAISEAIDRIRSSDLAPLAGHLADRIRKGQWLSYSGSANWHIDHSGPLPRK